MHCNLQQYYDAHRQRRQSHGTGGHVLAIFDIYLNSVNCAEFVQSILKKIVKIVSTRCHYFKAKMHQIDFGCGSAPDPDAGIYSAPHAFYSWISGAY